MPCWQRLPAALLIPPADNIAVSAKPDAAGALPSGIGAMVLAYGLFGFGYVITATFLVAIVRLTNEVRVLEPWVWTLFGLAAIPSVTTLELARQADRNPQRLCRGMRG